MGFQEIWWDRGIVERVDLAEDRDMWRALVNTLTFWPWSWTFTVQHTIYVKCEYFVNQEG
jgi:hypothetical protein